MSVRLRLLLLRAIPIVASACATTGQPSYDSLAGEYRTVDRQLRAGPVDDPHLLDSERLERAALIRAVLARNPTVDSARQAWRAALARYQQAGAYDDPMLMTSFAPLSIGADHAPFGYEVEISQAIPLGGKLSASAALAAAETQVAQSDFHDAQLRLASAASDLYDDYYVAARSLEIQTQHIAHMAAIKQNTVAAYESGHATVQDSLQADAEIARLEYQTTIYETQRDVTIAQINALLHRAPEAPLPPPPADIAPRDEADPGAAPANTGIAPLNANDRHADATPIHSIEDRPDIAAAHARVRVARARASAADSDYYPDLTLLASYNSMWEMPEHRFMAGVSLNVPLQRSRREGGRDEASAMHAMSESELQSVTDAARSEIAIAQRQVEGAARAVELYEQRLVPVARDRTEAARAGFITAQTNFTMVIEAEHGLLTAELELEMARADLRKRHTALDRALGRVPGRSASELQP